MADSLRDRPDQERKALQEELWYTRDSGEMLGMFISGGHAFLLYLQEKGDAGLHSYNPEYNGPEKATVTFLLDNGQRDEYPLAYTVSLEQAQRAKEHFLLTGKPAPWIEWLP